MKTTFKLGLDIHGVIDKEPELFSKISSTLKENGCEIHILTGSHITSELIDELNGYGMVWDELFSISDYHKTSGVEMWYDDNGNPWIDNSTWDMTKGEYCDKHNITFHMDDTRRYGEHFKTEFLHLDLSNADEIKIPSFENIKTEKDFIDWFTSMFYRFEKYTK